MRAALRRWRKVLPHFLGQLQHRTMVHSKRAGAMKHSPLAFVTADFYHFSTTSPENRILAVSVFLVFFVVSMQQTLVLQGIPKDEK